MEAVLILSADANKGFLAGFGAAGRLHSFSSVVCSSDGVCCGSSADIGHTTRFQPGHFDAFLCCLELSGSSLFGVYFFLRTFVHFFHREPNEYDSRLIMLLCSFRKGYLFIL